MTGARAVLILLSVVMLFAAFPVAGSAKDAGDMKLCPGGMAFGVSCTQRAWLGRRNIRGKIRRKVREAGKGRGDQN